MQEVQEMKLKQERIERKNAPMLRRGQDVEQHFEESSNGEQSTTRSATSLQIQSSGNQRVEQSRPPPSTCIIS